MKLIQKIHLAIYPEYNIPWRIMLVDDRHFYPAEARQLLMYFARVKYKKTLTSIGRELGRDHTTVRHAVKSIEKKLAKSESFRLKFNKISERLDRTIGVPNAERSELQSN